MKGSVVRALILADWHRHRLSMLLSVVAGAFALLLIQTGGELGAVIGSTWFFVSLIVLGCMVPVSNVINERKKQTLPFLLSLPISAFQYAVTKIVSTVGMFFLPWSSLVLAGIALILGRESIPNGAIPALLILANATFVGFCLIAGVALVSESEGWTIAATVASNSSYGLFWYLIVRNPELRATLGAPKVIWSPDVLTILGAEIAASALILAVTFYLNSRKRDFV
jgi:hypothetical protein